MAWGEMWLCYKEVIDAADSLEALTKREDYYQRRGSGLKHKVKDGVLVPHRYNTNHVESADIKSIR